VSLRLAEAGSQLNADHIYTLKQNLVFFEVILNHDHPVLTGLLRLAADAAKNHNDKLLYRIYIVTLLFLGSTATTGVFSMNADVPHNGDRERHLRADGTRPPPIVFGLVLIPVACVLAILWAYVRFAWHAVLKGHRKKREVRY
jgi:magnesium transporter